MTQPSTAPAAITRDEVKATYRQLAGTSRRGPTIETIERLYASGRIPFGIHTVVALFGTHNRAVTAAGLLPYRGDTTRRLAKDVVAKLILDWIKSTGRLPGPDDFDASDELPSVGVVTAHFRGIDQALENLGRQPGADRLYAIDELVDILRNFRRVYGRRPRQVEFGTKGVPAEYAYEFRIPGGLEEAYERSNAETHAPPGR